jgi:hypothetical protein
MVRRSWFVAPALLVLGLAAGCSGSDGTSPEPTARPTPIAKIDAGAVSLARAEFCDRLPDAAVRRALGGDPESDDSWGNGDPVGTDAGSGDVGHEIGCAWTGAGGTAARAWVFARPVDAALARDLARAAGHREGCSAEPTSVFGSPALLQRCTLTGGLVRERRAGLFGDTWLTCEVTAAGTLTPRERSTRLDTWCAQVVAALDTSG